ncbi:MAG: asparagine synthase (glutamine-hydrolyzing) [Gammaproteobacteria bacterium]
MCGIVGIVDMDAQRSPEYSRVKRMRDTLVHRGPDDSGIIMLGRVALAHRRLSIIDISGGHQPMANAERTIWIVYNGEIYNYRELRSELSARGCRFTTASDTEVILRAYEVYGEDCVRHLRGMFAFAIWDETQTKLFLARDRLGIKPLYYAVAGNEILFGSEIKALIAGGLAADFNKAILPEYLATRFVSGSETFFRGVNKLLPAHTLTWTPTAGVRVRRYWELPQQLDDSGLSMKGYAREVRERLEDAVRSHLVSDVPVGLFLSGGVDSSTLACLMAPMMDEPVRTFGIGFSEHGYNELSYARLVAEKVGAEHRDMLLSPEEFFDALPRMVWHEDEPIAFPSSVSLYFVSRLASEHVKVVMTGEGADELFLGYNRYRVTAWNERLGRPYWAVMPRRAQSRISRMIGSLPRPLRRYAERSFVGLEPGIRGLFYENFAVFNESVQEQLLADGSGRDPYAEGLKYYDAGPGGVLERMCYADMQTYLVELLMKQDQMSMAASIESRVPFLDNRFVEYAAAIPSRYKLNGWKTKAVLRSAVKDILPPEILARGKMGFPVPLKGWLSGRFSPLLDEFVLSPRARERALFNPDYLNRLVDEHRNGIRNHSDRLWMLMNLEIWQRIFLDEEAPQGVLREAAHRARLRAVA